MMKILKFLFLVTGLAVCALAPSAGATPQEAPDVLVKRITNDVMETARNDKEIQSGNRQRIVQLVESKILPHVDVERAVSIASGRHWRDATPQQRQQLTHEFQTLLIRTYAGGLSLVGDQKLEFKPLRADPEDTEVELRFVVKELRGREPIEVSYRLYKAPDGWKVYDVNVLGVWLVETYRSSFAAEISRGGIDGLIRTLAQKNRALERRSGNVLEPPRELPRSSGDGAL